jgi:hypothetical protein
MSQTFPLCFKQLQRLAAIPCDMVATMECHRQLADADHAATRTSGHGWGGGALSGVSWKSPPRL